MVVFCNELAALAMASSLELELELELAPNPSRVASRAVRS